MPGGHTGSETAICPFAVQLGSGCQPSLLASFPLVSGGIPLGWERRRTRQRAPLADALAHPQRDVPGEPERAESVFGDPARRVCRPHPTGSSNRLIPPARFSRSAPSRRAVCLLAAAHSWRGAGVALVWRWYGAQGRHIAWAGLAIHGFCIPRGEFLFRGAHVDIARIVAYDAAQTAVHAGPADGARRRCWMAEGVACGQP